jgi:hypothetical protein
LVKGREKAKVSSTTQKRERAVEREKEEQKGEETEEV